jgi:hypothetical protein
VHDRRQFDLHLAESLARQPAEIEVLPEWNADNHIRLARYYNRVLDSARHDRILFCHPDIEFPPGALSQMCGLFDARLRCGAVGVVGISLGGRCLWSGSYCKPKQVSTLDSCAIMVDRRQGFRFDEQTFDGFHCVVEDYCLQVEDQGYGSYVAAPFPCAHWGATLLENAGRCEAWMSDFLEYSQRLERKWPRRLYCTTAGGLSALAREIVDTYVAVQSRLNTAETQLKKIQRSPTYRVAKALAAPFLLGKRLLRECRSRQPRPQQETTR